MLNQTARLSPAPQEQDARERAAHELCSGAKRQRSSDGGRDQTQKRRGRIGTTGAVCLRTRQGFDTASLGLAATRSCILRNNVKKNLLDDLRFYQNEKYVFLLSVIPL